jgi:hypothetical protein
VEKKRKTSPRHKAESGKARELSWKQVNGWRLAQHYLIDRAKPKAMTEVVRRVGALQAQIMSAAELQLWARIDGLKPEAVQQALWEQRRLIKTWVLRGTLHLIAAEDFPFYVAALSAVLLKFYGRGSWLKYNKVTQAQVDAIVEGIDAALGEQPMSRKQLAEAIAKRTGSPELEQRLLSGWGVLLKPAAVQGRIIFGVSEGQNVTFMHPRRWLKAYDEVDTETAFRELARRYLNAYGPASAEDFGHWFGMQPADAKKAFRLLGDEIEQVEVEGYKAWALRETLGELENGEHIPSVRLLPYFDPYVISASKHSDYLLDAPHKTRVYRAQGWISPVVLVDGRMEGVWEHELKKGKAVVTVTPFATFSKAVKQGIEAEAERLGAFLSAENQVVYEQ